MPPTKPDVIGSAEACKILGRDRSTLTRWVESGRLDYWVKMPGETGAYLFERHVVEALRDELAAA